MNSLKQNKKGDILKNLCSIINRDKMVKRSIVIGILLALSSVGINIVNSIDNPQADFTFSPQAPTTEDVVQFTDLSTFQESIIYRMWYFGDGSGSLQKNPTHKYSTPGVYTVRLLVVWNISGNTTVDVAEKNITVINRPPIANAGKDQVVSSKTVKFNGSKSYDPDGVIVSYIWDFGDGTTGSGEIVQHTYAKDGNYSVTLNVTDDFGAYDTDECKVTVDTTPPVTTINVTGIKGKNGWFISNVTVKLTAKDNTSGVDKIYYRINNGTWNEYKSSFKISEEKENLVEYYSTDKAGNKEETKNMTIKIDKTKPTIKISVPEDKKLYIFGRGLLPTLRKPIIIGKITVIVNASDNIGIDIVKFYVNDEEKYNVTQSPYEWKWGGDIGRKTLKVEAFDFAGLKSSDEIEVFILSFFEPRSAQYSSVNL